MSTGPVPTINVITEAADEQSDVHASASPNSPHVESPDSQHPSPLGPGNPSLLPTSNPPSPMLRVPSRSSAATSAPSSTGPLTPSAESDSGSMQIPPSPTASVMSSPFEPHSTLKLRDNHPDATSGKGSLDLLKPGHYGAHGRKLSWSSNDGASEYTEPEHLMTPTSPPTSPNPKSTENDDDENGLAKRPTLDLANDHTDPTPFAFNPTHLASSLDPKNIDQLGAWGGSSGLLNGLGTDSIHGLSTNGAAAKVSDSPSSGDDRTAVDGSQRGDASTAFTGSDAGDSSHPNGARNSQAYAATVEDRQRVYGANVLPDRKSKSLLQLMWLALKDRVLILLCIAAAVSLALGLYQDLGTPPEPIACPDGRLECFAPRVDWVEGVAILVAVLIVVVVGSVNDWQKERQFKVLNSKKEDRGVKVIRDGAEQIINVKDVVVGDICLLEPGEIVPVDGVFLRGHNVKCDESGATGESDAVRKGSFEECMEEVKGIKDAEARGEDHGSAKKDPFLISGSKVMEGVGAYVVVAVGERSFNGRIMMGLRGDTPSTPLQLKLNRLAELIAKIGSLAGLILFSALMIKFFVQLKTKPNRTANDKAMSFVQILIISVTLIVVAVPEGLPLAVTLALAFATKRMTKENLLVRVLGSCETMANASVVCTDKTGTLTTNVMSVVAGAVGINAKFVRNLEENSARSNANDVVSSDDLPSDTKRSRKFADDFAIDAQQLDTVLSPQLRHLFNDAIAINSTAFEDKDPASGELVFVGSKTETALLRFAKDLGWGDYKHTRESASVAQMIPFSSERKAMGVVVKISHNKWRLYLKGAAEILTKASTSAVVVGQPGGAAPKGDEHADIESRPIDDLGKENINRTIIFYANQMLRCIALCYRDFESWPPVANVSEDNDEVPYSYLSQDLTLIGLVGIEDPLRPGVREAVAQCQTAGVAVKMCTGDNVLTARSIATQCGIYSAGGIIMEGPAFRRLSPSELLEVVPRLQVLARSSPEDKKILVSSLKQIGEIVGVTGDGSNDSLALKEAHVGFSMGIAGTEVAKEASDIIVMDDNFASIVSAVMWGRCVNDAVKKFLQFQISVNITAVIITFVTAVVSDEEESVLTAVQLLWINIIMDTFAALALATDPAHRSLLNRKPDRQTAPLFTVDMCKQIIGQSLYQTTIILLFHFAGNSIFGWHDLSEFEKNQRHTELNTLVFNAFVFCQIFNSINSRRLDNHLNIFEGILRNYYFIGITLLEIGIQVLIIFVGGSAFQVTRISGRDWGVSIALGIVALPLGALIRCIPNGPCERILVGLRILPDPNALPTQSAPAEEATWNPAITRVRDNLTTFAKIRGGRMRGSSFVGRSRDAKLEKAGIQLPSLLTMVPTLVASTIGAGWAPQAGSLSDPAHSDPSTSSAQLFAGQMQIHPDTDPSDPFYKKYRVPSAQ